MLTRASLADVRWCSRIHREPLAFRSLKVRRFRYTKKFKTKATDELGALSPQEALFEALRENGLPPSSVRLTPRSPGTASSQDFRESGESFDDEETWEDILDESHDPWMRSPAPPEDTLASAALLLPSNDLPSSRGRVGSQGAEQGQGQGTPSAGAGGSAGSRSTGEGSSSAYEATVLASMTWGEFQKERAAEGATEGEGEEAGGWAVLDVRRQPLEGGSDPRNPPGCIPLPLEQLSRHSVEALRCARFAVLMTDDVRGQQACVRLRHVYGYQEVLLLLDWQQM